MELGGFAENPKVIDGDFNAFNYCTAENYVAALYDEDFDAIGEIDEIHFEDICYWYNYDKQLNHKQIVDSIMDGSFITKKNRTILDAIYENKNVCLAEIYAYEKVYSPKVLLTLLLYSDYPISINPYDTRSEHYNSIFKDLFDFIDLEFNNMEDKKEFLKTIKDNITRLRYSKNYNNNFFVNSAENYEFVKQIRRDKTI